MRNISSARSRVNWPNYFMSLNVKSLSVLGACLPSTLHAGALSVNHFHQAKASGYRLAMMLSLHTDKPPRSALPSEGPSTSLLRHCKKFFCNTRFTSPSGPLLDLLSTPVPSSCQNRSERWNRRRFAPVQSLGRCLVQQNSPVLQTP